MLKPLHLGKSTERLTKVGETATQRSNVLSTITQAVYIYIYMYVCMYVYNSFKLYYLPTTPTPCGNLTGSMLYYIINTQVPSTRVDGY